MFNYLLRHRLIRFSLFFPVLLLTAGCSQNNSDTTASDTKAVDGRDDTTSIEKPAAIKTISVDNQRCTGCGKCSRFDPEHFSFNMTTNKAEVISQDNLESNDLRFAISACQDRAIALK